MKLSQRRMGRPSLSGMLATRQGALLLAILCAVCAAGILMFALSSYKRGVSAPVAAPPQATVLVAAGAIPKGTSGSDVASQSLYKSTPIAASQVAAGAISDPSLLVGKVAQSDILAGAQLTAANFNTTITAAALLAPSQRAVSIQPDEVHGDLDVLAAGDHVDVYAELTQNGTPIISLLDPNTLVLKAPGTVLAGAPTPPAAGTPAAGTPAAAAAAKSNGALVLAVTSAMAPDLALSADTGKLWLILRPANATTTPGGITTGGDIVSLASTATNFNNNRNTNPTGTHR